MQLVVQGRPLKCEVFVKELSRKDASDVAQLQARVNSERFGVCHFISGRVVRRTPLPIHSHPLVGPMPTPSSPLTIIHALPLTSEATSDCSSPATRIASVSATPLVNLVRALCGRTRVKIAHGQNLTRSAFIFSERILRIQQCYDLDLERIHTQIKRRQR